MPLLPLWAFKAFSTVNVTFLTFIFLQFSSMYQDEYLYSNLKRIVLISFEFLNNRCHHNFRILTFFDH